MSDFHDHTDEVPHPVIVAAGHAVERMRAAFHDAAWTGKGMADVMQGKPLADAVTDMLTDATVTPMHPAQLAVIREDWISHFPKANFRAQVPAGTNRAMRRGSL